MKRRFIRIRCRMKASVEHQGHIYHGHLENISLNGALLRLDETISARPGEPCRLSVYCREEKAPLRFRAKMVHVGFSMAGMSFLPLDEPGTQSLIALLESFMPDVQKVSSNQIVHGDES